MGTWLTLNGQTARSLIVQTLIRTTIKKENMIIVPKIQSDRSSEIDKELYHQRGLLNLILKNMSKRFITQEKSVMLGRTINDTTDCSTTASQLETLVVRLTVRDIDQKNFIIPVIAMYAPPGASSLRLDELKIIVAETLNRYDNVIIGGYFNYEFQIGQKDKSSRILQDLSSMAKIKVSTQQWAMVDS